MLEAGVPEFNQFLAGQSGPGPGWIRCDAIALA
jgi:hypothetical protein